MKSVLARFYRSVEAFLVDHSNSPVVRFFAVLLTLVDLRREATSVVWGRYHSRQGEDRAALTSLRRDVHRVEKGLVMRPRRVPFGKDYVPGLVASLRTLTAADLVPEADLAWANDVLKTYFEVTAGVQEPWLEEARSDYKALVRADRLPVLVPGPRSQSAISTVTFDELEQLAQQRRSVRWFEQTEVDPQLVDQALKIAGQAPSACNRQNIRFHMVYGTSETKRILSTVGGTRGFGDQVPAVAILIGRLAGYRYGFDRHAIFIDGGLASMGFLFGLETLGLSSCCINWPDVGSRYAAIKKLIQLEDDEQVLMLIAIGKADPEGLIPSSHKRALDQFRTI
jgi:nitroreductase